MSTELNSLNACVPLVKLHTEYSLDSGFSPPKDVEWPRMASPDGVGPSDTNFDYVRNFSNAHSKQPLCVRVKQWRREKSPSVYWDVYSEVIFSLH